MIGFLEGQVRAVREGRVIILAGGVGYRVAATKDTLVGLREDDHCSLWIYTAVREDALDLYGFLEESDLLFFELLLTVSGIGPRSALGILDIASTEMLRSAISAGKASYLTTVSGIGKKTAEKIVLELRDKITGATGAADALAGDAEALEAMRALGYSLSEARDALREVPQEITTANDRLREALRIAGKR